MKTDISIGIVATDEIGYLKRCLSSIADNMPAEADCEIIVIDNASDDGTGDFVKSNYPSIELIRNKKREGFAKNLNSIVDKSRGEYLLVVDANAYVSAGYITKLLERMRSNERAGLVSGKLLKADENGKPVKGPGGLNVIDSTGHVLLRDRRVVNRGEMEEDRGQFELSCEVFGVCTAATLLDKKMLKDIQIDDEYFDGSFYSHKEDVDLCWRARHAGWRSYYAHDAVAFHTRSWPIGMARKDVPRQVRMNSLKNRYLLLIKNEFFINLVIGAPFILFYELKMWSYIVLFERFLFRALIEVARLFPLALSKRRKILGCSNMSPSEIRKWAQ